MLSIDDVYRQTDKLLDALIRSEPFGMTGGMGQVGSFPGLVPRTYYQAGKAREHSAETLTVVKEISALLNAINKETLDRIEGRVNTINDVVAFNNQKLVRIESDLEQVMQFLPTVREDMTDLSAKLETIVAEVQQGMTDLNAKLDGLKADIQALPH